jgi:hypothetical protein
LVLRVAALVLVFPLLGAGKPGLLVLPGAPLGLLSFLFFLLGINDISMGFYSL